MSDDTKRTALIATIVVLALLVLWGTYRIHTMGGELDELRGRLLSAEQSSSQIHPLRLRLNEIEEAQKWVASVEWDYDESSVPPACDGSLPVTANVQLRELQEGESISVEARTGNRAWQSIETISDSTLLYHAETELELMDGWEYRVVGESNQRKRVSDPEPIGFFRSLIARDPEIHTGEGRRANGEMWYRFVATNRVIDPSPCKEIKSVALEIRNSGNVVETIEMQDEHPGGNMPPGAEGATGGAESNYAFNGFSSFNTSPDYAVEPAYEENLWWSDWVQLAPGDEVIATFTYSDGAVDAIEAVTPLVD